MSPAATVSPVSRMTGARRANCGFAWSAPVSTDRFCKTSETIYRTRSPVTPTSRAISS